MPDLSVFNAEQKKFLRYLYEHPGEHTWKEICSHCGSMHPREVESLTKPAYGQAVQRTSSPAWGDMYRITAEGRGLWESLQKQIADESYQRDYNAKALEVAQESNNIAQDAKDKAFWANVFSLAALLVSLAAVIVTIWAELRA